MVTEMLSGTSNFASLRSTEAFSSMARIWRSSPSRTSPAILESIFVQRHDLLDDLLARVKLSGETGHKHHMLLIGASGLGKSHLLAMLESRVCRHVSLTNRMYLVKFSEDEVIVSYSQLLKRIYEMLAGRYPDHFNTDWLNQTLGYETGEIESLLRRKLVSLFEDRTLLLMMENLDHIFDGLGQEGQMKLRAFLQEHPFICTVSTSKRLFKTVQDRNEPFYGFFHPIHLKPLQLEEAVELLSRIAEFKGKTELVQYLATDEGRLRVKALYHLAGGNHRCYVALSGRLTPESLNELTQPFERIVDELTPYFQEYIHQLSPQQRQIVTFLASQSHTVTPKFLAKHLLTSENTMSSQLKKLKQLGYVITNSRGRESLYELAEPFMRLAFDVQAHRDADTSLSSPMIIFLREWYQKKEHKSEVDLVYRYNQSLSQRRTYLEKFIAIYSSTNGLVQLGDGLVRSLNMIDADRLTAFAMNEWRELWQSLGSGFPELEIPLRIFSCGIDYLIAQDEKVLLDLIETERRILQEVLGLN